MQCPNCQEAYTQKTLIGNQCPSCGIDVVLFEGISRLSNKMYNQGLERLNAGDFTNGITFLTKSVAINKNHVQARNLLGLALFEVGHIGDALKHWIISQSITKIDNPAIKYIDMAHKNGRSLEKLNDATSMYNYALEQLEAKSDDLAIIQLKKAVEINPRFIDAHNLLTLCYLIQKDKDRALATANKVLSMDEQNPIALGYLNQLSSGRRPKSVKHTQKKPVPAAAGPYKAIGLQEKKVRNFHIAEILTFIVGVLGTIAFFYFIIIPATENDHYGDLQRARQELTHLEESHLREVQTLTAEKDALDERISELEEIIVTHDADVDLMNRNLIIQQAYWFYQDDQVREALDLVQDLDLTDITFDQVNRVEEIRAGAYARLGPIYFAQGQAAFNAENFAEALAAYEQAYYFLQDTAFNQWATLYFRLGSSYYHEGRFAEAVAMLTEHGNRFPQYMPVTRGQILSRIAAQS